MLLHEEYFRKKEIRYFDKSETVSYILALLFYHGK